MNNIDSFTTKNIRIYAEDISEEMRNAIINITQRAFQTTITTGKVYSTIASMIQTELDKRYPPIGWSCIVGKHFGTCVTHEMKTYL